MAMMTDDECRRRRRRRRSSEVDEEEEKADSVHSSSGSSVDEADSDTDGDDHGRESNVDMLLASVLDQYIDNTWGRDDIGGVKVDWEMMADWVRGDSTKRDFVDLLAREFAINGLHSFPLEKSPVGSDCCSKWPRINFKTATARWEKIMERRPDLLSVSLVRAINYVQKKPRVASRWYLTIKNAADMGGVCGRVQWRPALDNCIRKLTSSGIFKRDTVPSHNDWTRIAITFFAQTGVKASPDSLRSRWRKLLNESSKPVDVLDRERFKQYCSDPSSLAKDNKVCFLCENEIRYALPRTIITIRCGHAYHESCLRAFALQRTRKKHSASEPYSLRVRKCPRGCESFTEDIFHVVGNVMQPKVHKKRRLTTLSAVPRPPAAAAEADMNE